MKNKPPAAKRGHVFGRVGKGRSTVFKDKRRQPPRTEKGKIMQENSQAHPTLPAKIAWRAGGSLPPELEVWDSYLVAVMVASSQNKKKWWWELSVITVTESGFDVDGNSWGWSWEDVEWYVPVKELAGTLPA